MDADGHGWIRRLAERVFSSRVERIGIEENLRAILSPSLQMGHQAA